MAAHLLRHVHPALCIRQSRLEILGRSDICHLPEQFQALLLVGGFAKLVLQAVEAALCHHPRQPKHIQQ